jgi:tryptophanyl-tRNA synthetase
MRAVTDSGPTEPNSVVTEPIQNLFTIMEIVSEPDTLRFFSEAYANCSIRYGDLKKQLAEDVIKFTAPIYERMKELDSNHDFLKKTARQGAEKARESASKTVREVREIIGIKKI